LAHQRKGLHSSWHRKGGKRTRVLKAIFVVSRRGTGVTEKRGQCDKRQGKGRNRGVKNGSQGLGAGGFVEKRRNLYGKSKEVPGKQQPHARGRHVEAAG